MSGKSKIGKGWLILSEDPASGAQEFLSLLSPRKSRSAVMSYVEQLYVDQFASLDEKVSYKKNRKTWPYPAEKVGLTNAICCGHSPIYWAHFCSDISISENALKGTYRYIKEVDLDLRPIRHVEGEVCLDVA